MDAIRQLGIDGTVPMFGRLVRTFSELTQNEPLAPIPAEIWRTHHVDLFSVFKFDTRGRQHDYAPKNLDIFVAPLAYSAGATRYADLHLDRQGALAWLNSGDATQHRGRRLELQQERDVTRRIRFNEAVVQAYEQTQGTLAAAAAERLSNGDVEGWYAAAITKERDVALYGRKPPSRVHIEVPQEHLQSYVFREKANELVDQFDDNQRYVDLEIGVAELERRIAEIKTWH